MITFDGVTKSYRNNVSRKFILNDYSGSFKPGTSVGIVGLNGAGKSTLLRMIAGNEIPDEGHIYRQGRISFPLGFTGSFNGSMTGRQNCRFAARIYDCDVKDVENFVEEFSELGHYFDMPIRTYSSGMNSKLSFGLSMALSFDVYLIDELTAVGDARFAKKCREAFAARRKTADVIMVSHIGATIKDYCDRLAILQDGQLEFFDNVDEGLKVYRARMGLAAEQVNAQAPSLNKEHAK